METEGEVVGIGESKRKRNRRKKGLHAFPKVWFNFLQAAENRRNKFKFIANECLQILFCQINSLKNTKINIQGLEKNSLLVMLFITNKPGKCSFLQLVCIISMCCQSFTVRKKRNHEY